MSHQGPPGGGYPDQPYDPPSDPWGGQNDDVWRDPTVPQPGYRGSPLQHGTESSYGHTPATGALPYQPGSAPTPAWEPVSRAEPPAPPPPVDRRGSTLLFIAVGMLVLVIAAAVGYALYLLSGDEDNPAGGGGGPATAPPSAGPTGTPGPGSTQDNIGLNAAMAQVGDCLTNLGT